MKTTLKERIAAKCDEIVPVATRVYYTPIFNKLKPANFKVPMQKILIEDTKIAVEKGDGDRALQNMIVLRESLENFLARISQKKPKSKKSR
jgi:hypothetical protein